MLKRLSIMLALSLGLVGGVFALILRDSIGSAQATPRVMSNGMTAPNFALPAQDGRTFQLNNYKGRTVFLAFVPSWTDARTVEETRALNATLPEFDRVGAKVLLVSSDSVDKAKAFHEAEKLPFPLLIDRDHTLARRFSVPKGDYRTTFVIDPKGIVKFRIGDAIIEPSTHGKQLIDISKCCVDEVMAARAHGLGKAVGDYSLPRMDTGNAMEQLIGDGKQKATVVLFLSVKCPCSNGYNERVRDLARRFANEPVRVIGVYSNHDETAGEISAHARQNGFTFPVFRDERALCADHFGASVTPEAFVLDQQRLLRYAGRIDDSRIAEKVQHSDLADAIQALLSGNAPSGADTHAFGCGIVREN